MKMETRPMIEPGKPALGRGIEELNREAGITLTDGKIDPRPLFDPSAPTTEEEQTGEAIPAIIRILAELPEAQCANVFAAVQAIRQTARRSSNEITRIGDELTRIERDKARREAAPKKRGWLW